MLEQFGTAFDSISIAQYTMALFGGFLFGLAVYCIRPKQKTRAYYIAHYNNYILSALLMFYFTFPFAQGLLGYFQGGSAIRLFAVSLTYLVYVLGFVMASCTYWLIEKKRGKDA